MTSRVRVRIGRRTANELGESLKFVESAVRARSLVAVHSEDHALAAVVRLFAVNPDGLSIVDNEREGGVRIGSIDGHEARIEASPVSELLARRTKSRLGNGVVLCDELEDLLGFYINIGGFSDEGVRLTIVSRTLAVILGGLNVRPLFSPTLMRCSTP